MNILFIIIKYLIWLFFYKMTLTTNTIWLSEQEMTLLLRIKKDPKFLVEKWFDKEKRSKLLNEIKEKVLNNSDLVVHDIIVNIEEKFKKLDEEEELDVLSDIWNIFINPLELVAKKINKYVSDSEEKDNNEEIVPLINNKK